MVSQPGYFNVQAFTNLGDLGDGLRLYTYAPATTTFKTAYTDPAGAVPHTYTSDGSGGLYIALDARGELPAPLYLSSGGYDLKLATAAGATIWTRRASGLTDAVDTLRSDLADTSDTAKGDALIGVKQPFTGAVAQTQHAKNQDWITVKDFGAVGTANPANETVDTAAFTAALASGKNVYIPEGTYYLSTTQNINTGVKLHGAGRGKVTINYSGTGNAFRVGNSESGIVLAYNPELGGFTLVCTNRASTVNGVVLQNAVYFKLFDIVSIGSGSPNSATPADRVLYGSGLVVTHNSILGTIENVSCRIWDKGYYFYTTSASSSHWSAAIEVHGGEVATNMYGIVIGDSTVGFSTASGVSFHDIWVQGNYTTGIVNYSGESVLFDNCYFEGNANYDYDLGGGTGNPVKCMLHRCSMATEDIGTTPYGTFPYLAKVRIRKGSFNSIVENNLSISTSIPLVTVDSAAVETSIRDNRLNSAIAAASRISNSSTTTITRDNHPEAATVAIGSITRAMDTASGNVATTGLGFKPTSIEFFAAVDATNERSIGGAGLTNSGYLNRCMTTDSTGANTSSADCIRIIRSSAGNEQKAVLASFDNDGFTLTWTKVGTPPANNMVVNYIARR
jgi:hypothetical protein